MRDDGSDLDSVMAQRTVSRYIVSVFFLGMCIDAYERRKLYRKRDSLIIRF